MLHFMSKKSSKVKYDSRDGYLIPKSVQISFLLVEICPQKKILKLLANRVIYGLHLEFQDQECVYGKTQMSRMEFPCQN